VVQLCPTQVYVPKQLKIGSAVLSQLKAAFHDTDTDILANSPDTPTACEDPREEIARVGRKDVGVSGESVSVSMSVSWNAAFTQHSDRQTHTDTDFAVSMPHVRMYVREIRLKTILANSMLYRKFQIPIKCLLFLSHSVVRAVKQIGRTIR